jgi:ribonuclease HI
MSGTGPSDMDAALRHVLALERRMLDPRTRRDPAHVASLLHPEFWEIGASGTRWDRAGVVGALADDPGTCPQVSEMSAERVAEDVVLVTYGTPGSRRSSLWVQGATGWRVRFHQGTATSP